MVTKGGGPNNGRRRQVKTTVGKQAGVGEMQKTLLIRRGWNPTRVWCEPCGGHVQVLTPEEAAAFKRTEVEAIDALIEGRELHWTESADGLPLVCLNSLL